MNRDDETSLSAFLDDELTPADRAAVAWSIESSPALARQLRALADARDAVAALDRPALPVDVSARVLARLDGSTLSLGGRHRWTRRLREATAVAGVLATAASLFGAMFFIHRATHPDRGAAQLPPPLAQLKLPPAEIPAPAPALALAPPEPEARSFAERDAEPVETRAPQPPLLARLEPPGQPQPVMRAKSVQQGQGQGEGQSRLQKAEPTLAKSPAAASAAAELASDDAERTQLKGMLQRPDVHRILIVTDVIDAGERIKTLIQRDPRKNPNFARITVTGGVVIDPRHPGDADVFTVVLDGRESERLLGQIDRNFPQTDVVVDPKPNPEMVAQLTRVGRIAVLPGVSTAADLPLVAATLEELPPRSVTRAEPARSLGVINRLDDSVAASSDREVDRPHETLPPRFPPTPGPATYLVWVTRPTVRH